MPLVTHSTLVRQLGKTWSSMLSQLVFSAKKTEFLVTRLKILLFIAFSPFKATFEVSEKMSQEKKKEDASVVKKMALEPDRFSLKF